MWFFALPTCTRYRVWLIAEPQRSRINLRQRLAPTTTTVRAALDIEARLIWFDSLSIHNTWEHNDNQISRRHCFNHALDADGAMQQPSLRARDQGLSLSILHPLGLFSSLVYLNRSCNLLGLPCQNSTISGLTRRPPQNSGTGILSWPSNFFSTSST